MLTITQKILEKKPDIYTFWNIRRDVIEKLEDDFSKVSVELKALQV